MPKYTITYFDGRGYAEFSRMILAYRGIEFEDKRIQIEDWPAMKESTPNGQIPLLTLEDGTVIPQSKTMARYLAKEVELCGSDNKEYAFADACLEIVYDIANDYSKVHFAPEENKARLYKEFCEKFDLNLNRLDETLQRNGTGYVSGKDVTYADIGLAFYTDEFMRKDENAIQKLIEKYPRLIEHKGKIFNTPNLKAYIAARKETAF